MARRTRDSSSRGDSSSQTLSAAKRTRTSDAPSAEEPTPWLVVSSALHAAAESNASSSSSSSASTRSSAGDAQVHATDAHSDNAGGARGDNARDYGGEAQSFGELESFPTRFASWNELDEYVQEFGATTFQLFRKRSSVAVDVRNAGITRRVEARRDSGRNFKLPELIPREWTYYSKTYVCTHGLRNTPRGEGLRTHTSVRDTGCTARIQATLRRDAAPGRYVIGARVTGSHNHPVSSEQYYSYAENRRITDPALLRDIHDMSARGELPKTVLAHIAQRVRDTTGKECVYKLKDIYNILTRAKKASEEQQLAVQAAGSEVTAEQQAATSAPDAAAAISTTASSTEQTLVRSDVSTTLRLAGSESREAAVETRGSSIGTASITMSLGRLGLLLEAAYSYRQAHDDVEQAVVASTVMIPKTISGFKHEVVRLAVSDRQEDVDFVLPKHALAGCETGIIAFCHARGLLPQTVGVRLPVTIPGSSVTRISTLSSRQLLTMKRFYLARRNIAEAKRAVEWIKTTSFSAYPSAPFDEFAHYPKHLFEHAIKLLPLTRTVIRGHSTDTNVHFGFTDAISGASLLKFSSHANIDVDCVKAVLLHMHARFHAKASFASPSFTLEAELRARCSRATTYGAFVCPKDFVAGVSQLQSTRWGGFVFDCAKKVCYLCAPTEAERDELQTAIGKLFRGLSVAVDFETSPGRPASTATGDSGILALLFVECMLLNATWGDNPIDSFDYFRVRYLMQAIQVVNKQDVNDITW